MKENDITVMEDQDIELQEVRLEEASFSLLAAFYNVNPCEELIKAVGKLMPADVSDPTLKGVMEMLTSIPHGVMSDYEDIMLELKRDWTKTFRGVSPDYGPRPPYSQVYKGAKDLSVISKLAEMYNSEGYTGFLDLNNRHDYIGTLIGYLAYLAGDTSEKMLEGSSDAYELYCAKRDSFIEEHIASWFGSFCTEADKHVSTDFYKGVLKLTTLTFYK